MAIPIKANGTEILRIIPSSVNTSGLSPGALVFNPSGITNSSTANSGLMNFGPGITIRSTSTNGAHLNFVNTTNSSYANQIRFYGSSGGPKHVITEKNNYLTIISGNSSPGNNVLRIAGKLLIGAETSPQPSTYNLFVEKGIITEKVKVSLVNEWSDIVFSEKYNLMPINELETFISTNNHLPGFPDESKICQTGYDLVEMDALLLSKIEELTLYIIELKEENEKLKSSIDK